jgi:HNH endonuclease
MIRAHVASWLIHYGFIPTLCVCHFCDNPPCINPLHLFLGTVRDNTHDMIIKGRKNPFRKLSDYQVRRIRLLSVEMTNTAIANMFGVNKSHVSRILHGVKRIGVI